MAYTIVAWILVQVAVAVVPVFEAPAWVLKVLLLFIALGFPIVVLLAWAYELTPEGLRRTPDALRAGERNSRLFDSALPVTLILALLFATLSERPWSASALPSSVEPAGPNGASQQRTVLAVMPFAALSSDSQVSALAIGLSDSVRNVLSVTHGLSTTGMASTLKASDAQHDRLEIAETLAVEYVVEGSIRMNDGETHVFAQLVRLPGGEAVWSKQFPYSNDGLEPVRNRIASSVAEEILGQAESEAEASGLGADAYGDWLRLLGLLGRGRSDDWSAAGILAESLTERAPEFGPAYAALAYLLASENITSKATGFHERLVEANGLLDEAMALAPVSPRVRAWRARALSLLTRWRGSEADFERVNRMFEEALRSSPYSGELHAAYAEHKLAWSETEDALLLSKRSLELDPLSTLANRTRIHALIRSGKRDVAEAEIDALTNLENDAERFRAELEVARGNLREALQAYHNIQESAGDGLNVEAIRLWAAIGEPARALQLIETQEQTVECEIWRLALQHDYAGAYELAKGRLSPEHPESALLMGVLAIEAGEHEAAVRIFSRYFQAWIDDAGPLRGPAAIRYAPWFARALMEVGRDTDASRLLDRHLAGLILTEDNLSPSQSGVYFAANYAARGRVADAATSLEDAVADGFMLTLGALGDPIDITKSTLLSSLDFDAARLRPGELQ